MTVYIAEEFTPDEADILRRYFTNLDGPVFALVNLPEVVKGALFARYSRSSKSLRRLFLDEFVGDLDITGDATIDATVGLRRAEELYDRVFFEYGDDSVAQLGGVHLACEQASNLLTKVLEWGRLMAYLEQSTRYIAYDTRIGGRYRYYRDPEVLGSNLGLRYIGDMDRLFDTYAELVPAMADFYRDQFPKDADDSDFVYRQAIRAKAFDAVRGVLPAASLSNVGIYGTGQGYEALLLRMRSHPLPESRAYADLMLGELRKVIPSFLQAGRPRRPRRRLEHLPRLHPLGDGGDRRAALPGRRRRGRTDPGVRLVDFDPDGEVKVVAAVLYPYTHVGEAAVEARVRQMGADERLVDPQGLRRRPGQPAPQAGPGVRAHLLPLRRPRRLRRLPGPPAPPDAHHRVAGPQPPPRLHPARRPSTWPAPPTGSTRPWSARPPSTTPWRTGSRPRPATRCPWPTRSASTSTSTPGRRCTSSSCAPRPRATPPTGSSARRCTG